MKTVGKANFNGHSRAGCPRCCGDSPMTETLYRGNGGVRKACCVECEPEVLERKKRDTERVRAWRSRQDKDALRKKRTEEARPWRSRQDKDALRKKRTEEARPYRNANIEKIRAYRRDYYQKNKDKLQGYRQQYVKNNPWFNRAASSRKRAEVKRRTVSWADLNKIAEVYRNCPEGMVVDHIVPLKGKEISGLHVHTNLQYLTPEANTAKSNKFDIHSGRG